MENDFAQIIRIRGLGKGLEGELVKGSRGRLEWGWIGDYNLLAFLNNFKDKYR